MKAASSCYYSLLLLQVLVASLLVQDATAFAPAPLLSLVAAPPQPATTTATIRVPTSSWRLYSTPEEQERRKKLQSLGYSPDEIKKATTSSNSSNNDDSKKDIKVRVDLVEDVDPLTLTAIGFALIAFNFLVLGNLGDGGIGGVVATIINLANQ